MNSTLILRGLFLWAACILCMISCKKAESSSQMPQIRYAAKIVESGEGRALLVKARAESGEVAIKEVKSGISLKTDNGDGSHQELMIDRLSSPGEIFNIKDDWIEIIHLNLSKDIKGLVESVEFSVRIADRSETISLDVK